MNVVHAQDFKQFKVPFDQYAKRYFIGHYSPAGNHLFAYAGPRTRWWNGSTRSPSLIRTRKRARLRSMVICQSNALRAACLPSAGFDLMACLAASTHQYFTMNDKPPTRVSLRPRISRRAFVASAATATLGSALDGVAAQAVSADEPKRELPPAVQMQFMRPAQLEKAIKQVPSGVYVPFGLIEWHGRHLPLGNDALKAHAILVKTAEQFGGAVYPPNLLPRRFSPAVSCPRAYGAISAAEENRVQSDHWRVRP